VCSELSDAVILAAKQDIRFVLGDRDILRTVGQAWEKLGFVDRFVVLMEFSLCTLLPTWLALRLFVTPVDGPTSESSRAHGATDIERAPWTACAPDAQSALLEHFGRRFPQQLGGFLGEQAEYVMGSLDRLDAPLLELCPNLDVAAAPDEPTVHRRARVLAILGTGTALAVTQTWLGATGRIRLSKEARRELARPSTPALRAGFLLPLLLVFMLLGTPFLYLTAMVHSTIGTPLISALHSLSEGSDPAHRQR
jgi:pheromone shutdown protein TraB